METRDFETEKSHIHNAALEHRRISTALPAFRDGPKALSLASRTITRALWQENGSNPLPAALALLLAQHEEVQALDLLSRPRRLAQEFQA